MADAGNAGQSGALVEHALDTVGVAAVVADQLQDQARIEGAAAGAHDQPVEGGIAKTGGDAASMAHAAQAGAVAQVGHHHALVGTFAEHLAKTRGDVLVGQAVEAVADVAAPGQVGGQPVAAHDVGLAGVEGGVEAGYLWQLRLHLLQQVDGAQVGRQVQRRQWHQRVHAGQRGVVHQAGRGELHAAVDHPVAGADDARQQSSLVEPLEQAGQGGLLEVAAGQRVAQVLAGIVLDDDGRRFTELLGMALDARFQVGRVVQGELQAGRAGIQNQQQLGHGMARPAPRGRWAVVE